MTVSSVRVEVVPTATIVSIDMIATGPARELTLEDLCAVTGGDGKDRPGEDLARRLTRIEVEFVGRGPHGYLYWL